MIKEDNPFPVICGRICNHRCEEACNRNLVDQPLSIASLKRFVSDQAYPLLYVPPDPLPYKFEEKVAIIGAGPCGLATQAKWKAEIDRLIKAGSLALDSWKMSLNTSTALDKEKTWETARTNLFAALIASGIIKVEGR